MFAKPYHPCLPYRQIGRGTALAVVGSSLAVIRLWDRTTEESPQKNHIVFCFIVLYQNSY